MFSESSSYYLSRWFKHGYGHVHAIAHIKGDWVLIDPSLHSLNFSILGEASGLDLIKFYTLQNPSQSIIHLIVRPNPDLAVYRLGPISCVSSIQYLLGIYWPLTLTPWALYSKLLTHTPQHITIVRTIKNGIEDRRERSQEGCKSS